MLEDITNKSNIRLGNVRELLLKINDNNKKDIQDPTTKIYKGLFFIVLYGAFEYTIVNCVQKCLSEINNKHCRIKDIKATLYCLVFNNECNALMDARNKKWEKRYELFSKIENNSDECNIIDSLSPIQQGNIKYNHLKSLWKIFDISSEVITDIKLRVRFEELVENRNAIAHGREPCASVGQRYTANDLANIFDDISEYCSYVIETFKDYIINQEFKR